MQGWQELSEVTRAERECRRLEAEYSAALHRQGRTAANHARHGINGVGRLVQRVLP